MIELEIQALSEHREGLLIDVGRLAVANGFTLQRHRLLQDPHGILLTVVVRGSPRKKRALEANLEACERLISFEVTPFVEGQQRAHFAASRAPSAYVPPRLPEPERVAEKAFSTTLTSAAMPAAATVACNEIEPATLVVTLTPAAAPPFRSRQEPASEFMLPKPSRAPLAAAPTEQAPFIEVIPLEPNQVAVDKLLSKLATEYPQIMPHLLALDHSVAEGAREPSLHLAGQRTGNWVFERKYAQAGKLGLHDAIGQLGVPALSAMVEIERQSNQLHIHHSPLCTEGGHSGCAFFTGFLEGLLGPAVASSEWSIFAVCCHSYGADACVLALSD